MDRNVGIAGCKSEDEIFERKQLLSVFEICWPAGDYNISVSNPNLAKIQSYIELLGGKEGGGTRENCHLPTKVHKMWRFLS